VALISDAETGLHVVAGMIIDGGRGEVRKGVDKTRNDDEPHESWLMLMMSREKFQTIFSCWWKVNARMRERERERERDRKRTGNADEIPISFAAHMHIRLRRETT
jgi:hypothetical protein